VKIPGRRESRRLKPAEAPRPRFEVPESTAPSAPTAAAPTVPASFATSTARRKSRPLRWLLVAGVAASGLPLGYVALHAIGSPREPSAVASVASQATGKGRVRKPLLLAAPLKGEAFANYYEAAAASLKVTRDQEKALAFWAQAPATRITAPISSAIHANARAFSFFEQGTSAETLNESRPLSPLLSQRLLALGRFELARGRFALEGADRRSAAERGFAVVRFAQDVIATGAQWTPLGLVLENEGLSALEVWLEMPLWRAEELSTAQRLLARALESVPDVVPKSEKTATGLKDTNGRLAGLLSRLDQVAAALVGTDPRASARTLLPLLDEVAFAVDANDRSRAIDQWRDFDDRWTAVEDPIRTLSLASYHRIESLMQDVSGALSYNGSWRREDAKTALADLKSACLTVANLPKERAK
jgi:hypothetical protein